MCVCACMFLIQGGKTPLYIAARGSFTAIVDMIIKTARLEYTPKVNIKFSSDRCARIGE